MTKLGLVGWVKVGRKGAVTVSVCHRAEWRGKPIFFSDTTATKRDKKERYSWNNQIDIVPLCQSVQEGGI